jgi:hypothetical protein
VSPAAAATPSTLEALSTAQGEYDRLKTELKGTDSFDVLICFMNTEDRIAYGRVWRFHIQMGTDQPIQLARLLASSGATHDPARTWVTIHGARGVACLLQSFLRPARLPGTYGRYVSCRSSCFPVLCDLAIVAYSSPNIQVLPATGCKGRLSHMLTSLGVAPHPCEIVSMLRCYRSFQDAGHLQNFLSGGLMERCCLTCTP